MVDQNITAATPGMRPDLFLLEPVSTELTVPECEADRRNRQALHALEVDWGRGVVDYGKIRAILAGRTKEECQVGHWMSGVSSNTVA